MLRNLARALFRPIRKLLISGIPFAYGWFALIRDEFLAPELADQLRFRGILARWIGSGGSS